MGKLKNGKATGKDEITGEMIKGGCDGVVDWMWRLCNMEFKSSVMHEGWRSAVIVPQCKGKGKRTVEVLAGIRCQRYYEGILVDRVRRVTGVGMGMSKGVLEQEADV